MKWKGVCVKKKKNIFSFLDFPLPIFLLSRAFFLNFPIDSKSLTEKNITYRRHFFLNSHMFFTRVIKKPIREHFQQYQFPPREKKNLYVKKFSNVNTPEKLGLSMKVAQTCAWKRVFVRKKSQKRPKNSFAHTFDFHIEKKTESAKIRGPPFHLIQKFGDAPRPPNSKI